MANYELFPGGVIS